MKRLSTLSMALMLSMSAMAENAASPSTTDTTAEPALSVTPTYEHKEIEPSEIFRAKIEQMFGQQAQSIRYFTAPNDLIAIGLATTKFKKQVYYTNANVEFVFSGRMFDTVSNEIHDKKIAALLKVQLPESLTNGIQEAPSFTYGDGEQVIYAVVDANCGYCKRFHQAITAKIESGQLNNVQVKYIPMGLLSPDSSTKAQAILSLPESERFDAWHSAVNRQPISLNTTEEGLQQFAEVQKFYESQSVFRGVPFVLTNLDGDWQMSPGAPEEVFYRQIAQTNQPKVPETASTTGN